MYISSSKQIKIYYVHFRKNNDTIIRAKWYIILDAPAMLKYIMLKLLLCQPLAADVVVKFCAFLKSPGWYCHLFIAVLR